MTKDGHVEKGEMATTIVDASNRVVLRVAPSPLEMVRNVVVLGALTLQFFPSVHVGSKIRLGVAVFILPDKKVKSIGLRKEAAGRLLLAQITHAQASTLVGRGVKPRLG